MPAVLARLVFLLVAVAALVWPGPAVAAAGDDWSEVVRGDPDTGLVAPTFDAGSVAGPTERILDTLRERQVRVTMFLTGAWIEQHPDLARQIVEDGHEIANHSYSHPDFVTRSSASVVWELEYTDWLASELTGHGTRPYFRPPFGSRNARVLAASASVGFRSVYWTLDSSDWRVGATAQMVRQRVLRLVQPGDIVVHHLASEATADALPDILDEIEARGWRVGTVTEVLGGPPLPEPTVELEPPVA